MGMGIGNGNWGVGSETGNWERELELGMEQGTEHRMSPRSFSPSPKRISCAATRAGDLRWQRSAMSNKIWSLSGNLGSGPAPISPQFMPWDLSENLGTGPVQCPVMLYEVSVHSHKRSQVVVLIFPALERGGNGHPRLEPHRNAGSGMKTLSQAEDFQNS